MTVLAAVACGKEIAPAEARASLCGHLLPLRAPYAATLPASIYRDLVESLRVDAKLLRRAGLDDDAETVDNLVDLLDEDGHPGDRPTDLSVFLLDTVTRAEQDAIAEVLREHPDVASVELETKEEALARFQELFADNPDLVAGVTAEDLPASFRVDVREGGDLEAVRSDIADLPGVDKAVRGTGEAAVVLDFNVAAAIEPLVGDCPPVQSGPP